MDAFAERRLRAGQVFTPGAPVNERDLFAGRIEQLQKISDAVSQRGYHAVLYGERGVGKTSLANILIPVLESHGYVVGRVNCDASDDFASIWRKALRDIHIHSRQMSIGFTAEQKTKTQPVSDTLPLNVTPDEVRRVLTQLSSQRPILIILDEFDRIADEKVSLLVSDTIKGLSDFGVGASLVLIGVADSIEELIGGHQSIERALVQVSMPRMSNEEIDQIVRNGMSRLGMEIDESGLSHLRSLSQGLPYIAHLLALHSTRAALDRRQLSVVRDDVDSGITNSLDQWQESIKTAYYRAVKSQQPGNIYREVLLACALAEVDDKGFFSAAAVRSPLCSIAGRSLDIPNFARHLKEFSEEGRGEIITRVGAARRLRYRFVSPLMRPYVIMRGYKEGLLV